MRKTTQRLLLLICVSSVFHPWLVSSSAIEPTTHVQHGLRVPAGFEVAEFTSSDLANDIYCMTIDPKGRIVVAGRGYIRILVDDNADGRADRAIEFADSPKDGAMGMLWEDSTLYVTGDGGLRRFRDANSDDRADGPSELIRAMKTGGEHTAHAIRRGPDGWLYVLGGDGAGFDKSFATLPTSPVKEPIGGCVIRLPPDFKDSEVVAHGFRNAYDMDFNPDGELFTYDSDNERCVSLPWYEPTRFYHVIPGGHHGWLAPQRAQFYRLPPYCPDVTAPVTTLGRGSPTACVCYRHAQFPLKYRGGFFLADWTFGRVYFVPLRRTADGYQGQAETFLQSTGDGGFAPTSAVVHPQSGDLFISIGGRGTRGGVYRIRHTAGFGEMQPREVARMQPAPRSLAWDDAGKREILLQLDNPDAMAQLRGLIDMVRHRERFTPDEIGTALRVLDFETRPAFLSMKARLVPGLAWRDRSWMRAVLNPRVNLLHWLAEEKPNPQKFSFGASLLREELRLQFGMTGLRLMQNALGHMPPRDAKGKLWEAYAVELKVVHGRVLSDGLAALRRQMPFKQEDLDREATRILAMAEDSSPEAFGVVLPFLQANSDPVADFHYLAVLARLPAARQADVTRRVADALLSLDRKIIERKLPRERNWYARLAELHTELAKKDPALNAVLLDHAEFGRPDHVSFTRAAGFDRVRAARLLHKRATADADYAWTPDLVKLFGHLPDEECFPVLRKQWEQHGLRDDILAVLTRAPQVEDRDRFVAGLTSPQLDTVRQCAKALERLPPREDKGELLAVVQALARLPADKEHPEVGGALIVLLARQAGEVKTGAGRAAWIAWFRKTYPDLAPRLDGPDDVDLPAWRRRLEKLDWSAGKVENGLRVYQRLGCAACHTGSSALGPDLKGVAGRFSRDDLFTAILQPSKDVSQRYQTVLLSTHDGKLYSGAIIYEAVDGVMLQTSATATVRVAGEQIAVRRPSPRSLMPAGLLDKCADGEIVDLYSFLRQLEK